MKIRLLVSSTSTQFHVICEMEKMAKYETGFHKHIEHCSFNTYMNSELKPKILRFHGMTYVLKLNL